MRKNRIKRRGIGITFFFQQEFGIFILFIFYNLIRLDCIQM